MGVMDDLRLDALDTFEGRAIYPYGSWAAGYLADAATERRLRKLLAWMPYTIGAVLALQSLARHFLHVPEGVGYTGAFVVYLGFYYAIQTYILRGCKRAAYRPSSNELLRLRLSKGRTAIVAAHWGGLVMLVAFAAMFAIISDGLERELVVVGCAASIILLVVNLRRIAKIPE